jgi:predicted transcriptional regulator
MNLDKEKKICKEHKEKGYCYWGICKYCGVSSFIRKMENGEVNHSEEKLRKFKEMVEERHEHKERD